MTNIPLATQTSREYYEQAVEDLAQGAFENCIELWNQDPDHDFEMAVGVTDENYYECIVGFGSALDPSLDAPADHGDIIALAFLMFSPNRDAIMSEERYVRLSRDDPKAQGSLFMGTDCIDYRMLAVAALHTDVMARFKVKMDAYLQESLAAIPFE